MQTLSNRLDEGCWTSCRIRIGPDNGRGGNSHRIVRAYKFELPKLAGPSTTGSAFKEVSNVTQHQADEGNACKNIRNSMDGGRRIIFMWDFAKAILGLYGLKSRSMRAWPWDTAVTSHEPSIGRKTKVTTLPPMSGLYSSRAILSQYRRLKMVNTSLFGMAQRSINKLGSTGVLAISCRHSYRFP